MANGNFAGGNGTAESPYLIEDAFDLDAVRNNLTAHYKMIADIDLNISPFNEGEGWTPIGDNSTNNNNSRFRGVFDGNGFVIKNLFINRPSTEYQGLFGYTFGSSIKNIGVEDVNITGGDYTGGLVGYNNSWSIIENSYSTGSVTGGARTGGLVGHNYSSSVIENSYSTGNVIGSNNTGGLVGINQTSSVIKNSYSTGSVTGSFSTGGLVGSNYTSSVIENSYSTGSVTGGSNTGGLVGYNNSSVINSYWNTETSGWTTSAGGEGKTTAEMQTPSTFVGWESETLEDGTPVWILQDGEYPKLWFEVENKILIKKSDGVYVYYDTSNNVWETLVNEPTEQDYLDYGMDDLSAIPESAWHEIEGVIKICHYTGNPTQETSVITAETDPYSVYDYISETPEVLVYTELDNDITVETTTEPFDLYDEFGDSVDVLYYTDDESVNEADLIIEANWSPLDELEEDFEVVVWTEEPSNTAQRVLKMTAIPNPQFIKLVNPLKLYGYLEDVLIDDISQTYKNKKETRYLITDENSNDWYVFDKNTREFKIVDASTHESIIENGMTFEDLNSIEEEDWKKWGKEWLNIGVFLKDNERDTIVSVIDNMSYKDFLPRDTSSLSETSLYILNTTARIDISINGNTIKGVLSDDDLTRVQYRVLLNGEHYYPEDGSFTDLSEPPQNIGITFTSKDIKVDELNTVRVEFRDFFGTIDYWEADFIGTYSGLVFKDIYGDYFSTEIGEVLKYLDFGVIVAGQVTVEHEIILKNQYGYDVKNIQLFANTSEFPDGMTIEFSDSLAPFNPQEKLIIPEVLESGEELSFYVRLRTTLGATPNANGSFDIIVKADRV